MEIVLEEKEIKQIVQESIERNQLINAERIKEIRREDYQSIGRIIIEVK